MLCGACCTAWEAAMQLRWSWHRRYCWRLLCWLDSVRRGERGGSIRQYRSAPTKFCAASDANPSFGYAGSHGDRVARRDACAQEEVARRDACGPRKKSHARRFQEKLAHCSSVERRYLIHHSHFAGRSMLILVGAGVFLGQLIDAV